MELHPTPFPVRSKYLRPKSSKQISEAPKPDVKGGPPLHKQKRVFGTARNPNIPLSSITQKPKPKPSSVLLEKSAKAFQTMQSPERNKTRSVKKSVCFQQKDQGDNVKFSPQTPVKPDDLVLTRTGLSATPYRSAERCSKCRFDRLETSAYWLGQIKLAESVGKHFVSAAFFRLAFDCKAEPFRTIRIELKKYLTRHEYLIAEEEWKNLLITYGLEKEASRLSEKSGEVGSIEDTAIVQGQEDTDEQDEEKESEQT